MAWGCSPLTQSSCSVQTKEINGVHVVQQSVFRPARLPVHTHQDNFAGVLADAAAATGARGEAAPTGAWGQGRAGAHDAVGAGLLARTRGGMRRTSPMAACGDSRPRLSGAGATKLRQPARAGLEDPDGVWRRTRCGIQRRGIEKRTAMSTSRASWNYTYEKGLVDVMKEHVNIPMYRAQNGWTAEGWRNMAQRFNETFPLAHFSKQQMQEKEKELKGSYKAIRDSRKESGVGWNETLSMLVAAPSKWVDLIQKYPKVSKFQKKPFPLYEHLEPLYAVSIYRNHWRFECYINSAS